MIRLRQLLSRRPSKLTGSMQLRGQFNNHLRYSLIHPFRDVPRQRVVLLESSDDSRGPTGNPGGTLPETSLSIPRDCTSVTFATLVVSRRSDRRGSVVEVCVSGIAG